MSDIEPVHRFAYDSGRDPIDHAVEMVAMQLGTRDQIRTARVHTPTAYPIFRGDLGDEATARRILALLMDAGWTPPNPVESLKEAP